jgi:hypothetical protein
VVDHFSSEVSVEENVPEENKMVENITAEIEDDIQGMQGWTPSGEGSKQGRVEVGISQSPAFIAHLFSVGTEDGSQDRDQIARWESFLEQGNSDSLLKTMGLMEEEIMDSQKYLGEFVNPEEIEGS